jgi:2-C-methyl-D-erythritol 2,4-cyclodiphosphate synthase
MRIGHGFDAHRFSEGGFIVLGGVRIAHSRGLQAHSDGDVLLHALCDALLGAAGLGDIGHHFPDNDATYCGIDSRILLRRVRELLQANHLRVSNVDLTVIAQRPRLAAQIPNMRANIASDLQTEWGRINVKATTTEGMGFVGREEGIAAHAVVLLEE